MRFRGADRAKDLIDNIAAGEKASGGMSVNVFVSCRFNPSKLRKFRR